MAASFLKECERSTSDSLFHFLDTTGAGRITIEDSQTWDIGRWVVGPIDPNDPNP